MDKRKVIFCTLAVLVMILLLCFGCSWTTEKTSKGSVIRCPKCGEFFSWNKGLRPLSGCERSRGDKEVAACACLFPLPLDLQL